MQGMSSAYMLAVLRLIARLGWQLARWVGWMLGSAAYVALAPIIIVLLFLGLHIYLAIATVALILATASVAVALGFVDSPPRRKTTR